MRHQLRTGTHPAVCGSMAWPGPLGVVKEQGSAQLGTGPIAPLDHSHKLGQDTGRPGRQWVGLRVHPQQDQGCRQLWHPRETSPTQRMGPIPKGTPDARPRIRGGSGRASRVAQWLRTCLPVQGTGVMTNWRPACRPGRTHLKLGVDFGSTWIPSARHLARMPHVTHRVIFKEGKRGFQLAQDRPCCGGMLISFSGFFFFKFYDMALVSAIQQCESAVITHTSLPGTALPSPEPPPGHLRRGSRGCRAACAAVHLTPMVDICRCHLPLLWPSVPPPLCPQSTLHLCLHSFLANTFINTSFSGFHIYALKITSRCDPHMPRFHVTVPWGSGVQQLPVFLTVPRVSGVLALLMVLTVPGVWG